MLKSEVLVSGNKHHAQCFCIGQGRSPINLTTFAALIDNE